MSNKLSILKIDQIPMNNHTSKRVPWEGVRDRGTHSAGQGAQPIICKDSGSEEGELGWLRGWASGPWWTGSSELRSAGPRKRVKGRGAVTFGGFQSQVKPEAKDPDRKIGGQLITGSTGQSTCRTLDSSTGSSARGLRRVFPAPSPKGEQLDPPLQRNSEI